METSQGSYRRLSRASYTPASSTVIKTRAPSSKKEQRIKNFKDSKLLLTAASPAAFFSEAQSVGTFSLEVKRWKKEVPRACGEFLPPRLAATQAILPPQSSSR